MNPSVRRVELADGVELQVELAGDGPAVVLLHGFTGDASTMALLAERLADDHLVVTPDLIGHGGSTGPDESHTVDAMATQVLAVLAALGVPAPYDVVGYSMGGRVALTMACRFPEQVASLSLIGASAGLATPEERAERAAADEDLAASILADGLESFVDRWMANPLFSTQTRLGDAFLADARAQRLRSRPEGLVRSLRGAGTGSMQPLHDQLHRCAMPVALVVGADDPKFRDIAEDLALALPDASITTVADAGHAAHLEQPDAVATAIARTIERGSLRVVPISLPLRDAHSTGRGTTVRRDSLLVGLRVDGHTGWGEASPLPGWSEEDLDAVRDALPESLALCSSPSAWQATEPWRESGRGGLAARAAVVGAAFDLDARRQGVPLWRHLAAWHPGLDAAAGSAGAAVNVNGLVSARDPDDVAAHAHAQVGAGITTIKLKVGAVEPDRDRARLAAARAAAPDAELRLDANGAWDHDTALEFLAVAESFDVALCEEPVRGIEAIAAIGREVGVPVAVDESVRSVGDLAAVGAHADGISALVVKPQALGGPDHAIDAILGALGVGLDVIVTSMIDSAVGLAHAAHVTAACGLPGAHGLATATMLENDVAPGLVVTEGRIVMPADPGLGIGLVSPPVVGAP